MVALNRTTVCCVQEKHQYPKLKGLHKQILCVPVGIGGCKYLPLRDFVTRQSDLSLQAISGLYETIMLLLFRRNIQTDLKTEFDKATLGPGIQAARYAQLVGDATSIAVTYLMQYREDGEARSLLVGTVGFIALESW